MLNGKLNVQCGGLSLDGARCVPPLKWQFWKRRNETVENGNRNGWKENVRKMKPQRFTKIVHKLANQKAIPNQPAPKHVKNTKFGECKVQIDGWEIACQRWGCRLKMAMVAPHHWRRNPTMTQRFLEIGNQNWQPELPTNWPIKSQCHANRCQNNPKTPHLGNVKRKQWDGEFKFQCWNVNVGWHQLFSTIEIAIPKMTAWRFRNSKP